MSFHPYTLIRKLESGICSTVNLCTDSDNTLVVVKSLPHPRYVEGNRVITVETIVSKKCSDVAPALLHYGIEPWTEDDRYSTCLVLVHPYIHGCTLTEVYQYLGDWDVAWNMLLKQLLCIKSVHHAGLVHGDAYTGNFIWTGERLYIIDFAESYTIDDTKYWHILGDKSIESKFRKKQNGDLTVMIADYLSRVLVGWSGCLLRNPDSKRKIEQWKELVGDTSKYRGDSLLVDELVNKWHTVNGLQFNLS